METIEKSLKFLLCGPMYLSQIFRKKICYSGINILDLMLK